MINMNYTSVEDGIEELKRGVNIRNQMGGAMYWNMLNDKCLQLADKLVSDGADRDKLATIGGWGIR